MMATMAAVIKQRLAVLDAHLDIALQNMLKGVDHKCGTPKANEKEPEPEHSFSCFRTNAADAEHRVIVAIVRQLYRALAAGRCRSQRRAFDLPQLYAEPRHEGVALRFTLATRRLWGRRVHGKMGPLQLLKFCNGLMSCRGQQWSVPLHAEGAAV